MIYLDKKWFKDMINDYFDMFHKIASIRADTVAIKYKSTFLTYKTMANLINRLSKAILDLLSEKHNVPVVIYQNRGIEFVISMLAVLQAGAYYIPIEKPIPIERLKYICNQINPKIILIDEEQRQQEKLPYPYMRVILQGDSCCAAGITVRRTEMDLAYVMYTSGTTGNPKGVKISYRNLCNLVGSFYDILYHEFKDPVNIGVISSFSFDASVKMIFPAFAYGNTLVISDKSVKNFGRKIHCFLKDNDVLISDGTPSHLMLMMAQKTKVFTETEYFIIGGENLDYQTLRGFCTYLRRIPTIINVYGPTECCVDIAYNRINKDDIFKRDGLVPIGKALPNNFLEIRDASQRIISQKLKKGELWIKGNQVGHGYVDGELRGFIFENNMLNRTYRTGDLAMYNEENEIIILGRLDRQVKINGNRIELDDISSVIRKRKECVNAEVELIQDNDRNYLVAFVVVKEDERSLIRSWNDFLLKELPTYMLPQKYIFVERIPLTDCGKVNRKLLKDIYFENKKEGQLYGCKARN